MKRITLFLLVFVLIASVLISCTNEGENASKSDVSEPEITSPSSQEPDTDLSETEEESSVADPYEHLRSFNFGDEDVMFLVIGDEAQRYKSVEIMEHDSNPDAINEAIKARNNEVESLLHVKIRETRVPNDGSFLTTVRNDVMGDGSYDIIMPYMPDAAILASEGALIDLKSKSDIIMLDRPYWDQRANSDLSFAEKLFFTTGDISLLTFDCTHAIVFNKTLAEEVHADNFYQLLADDKWTFDALLKNAKLATHETNGVDGMTYEDTWGFFVNVGYATTMFLGAGERLTIKNREDIPTLSLRGDRTTSVVSKIREIFNDKTSTIVIEKYSVNTAKDSDVYSAASRATAEGRALFRALAIVDLQELDNYPECAYGILPTPKFNDAQEGYYNIVSAILASCVCIHNGVSDEDKSAAVLEAMTCASANTVRTAYYDKILKGRRIPDDEGEDALDTIFNNRVYEMATIYKFSSLDSLITASAQSSADIYISTLDSIEDQVNDAINELADTYANFID